MRLSTTDGSHPTVTMKKIFFSLIFFLVTCLAFTQGLYNKGSVISLAPQTILIVPDSLVNNGTLINNGDLRIAGAWINGGTYVAGIGEINFDSDLPQVINHNDQSVANLTISGGGEKQFLANIIIQSELKLESGILRSGNNAKIILNEGVVVTGGSDNSHIQGPVERRGKGDWLFPTGNGIAYLPVEITNVTDPAATATLALNELTSGQVITGDQELAQLSTRRYWELVLGGGKLDESKIKLPVSGEEGLTGNVDLLVVAGSNSATASYSSLGQSNLTGTLTSGSVTSEQSPAFAFFTVAAILGERGIEVFNAVSPNGDGKNEFMKIRNIELYPDNRVIIVNRWGDRVFEMPGYNNDIKIFRGESNVNGNSKLPGGTYFYFIDLGDGSAKKTGILEVR